MAATKGFDLEAHVDSFCERLVRAVTIEETRRAFDSYAIEPAPIAGALILEIESPSGSWIGSMNHDPGCRGLYLHGGGYMAGGVTMYAGLVSRLATVTGSWIFVPNMPLAPEYRFPSAHHAALGAAGFVLSQGPLCAGRARRLFLMGDSCGAALALATAMRLRDECRVDTLSAIVGLSPTLDMTATGDSYKRCAKRDRIVSPELTRQCAMMYAPDLGPTDARLSPLYGAFTGLPPVLLQVSEDESVFDDSGCAAMIARQQGCLLEVQAWPGMPHVWHLLAPRVQAALDAIERIGEFITRVHGDGR